MLTEAIAFYGSLFLLGAAAGGALMWVLARAQDRRTKKERLRSAQE